jgi:hypothetical protein
MAGHLASLHRKINNKQNGKHLSSTNIYLSLWRVTWQAYTENKQQAEWYAIVIFSYLDTSVANPDPDPPDQHVFGPPGSGCRKLF